MGPEAVLFDRYRLEERIGAGGMGEVWRATDLLLDQSVALKRVRLVGGGDQDAERSRQPALREARMAARLRHHRNVVATYDVRVADGDVWLVLEYLPGQSLAQILRERGPLDPGEVARIGVQVADALAAAHALGIEHRDVTPGNVLITDDGTAKLTDFGISSLTGDAQLTQAGVIAGTVAYLAPEVARTGKPGPASDVFALGATLYAAIEGQPPFGNADDAAQQLRIVSVGIIRPPTAAGALTPLLQRLLQIDPATRPDATTARDLLEELATQINAPTPGNGALAVSRVDGDGDPAGGDICPYPGLAAFGPAEAEWFFGRDHVTADVVARLDERLAGGGLLAVVAPSGAGKSSLLAAGLIPALARGEVPGSRTWPVVDTTPGAYPLGTLLDRVAEETGADSADLADVAGDPDRFVSYLAEAVAAYTGRAEGTPCSARIVLIIDQFEEVFTACQQETEQRAFIAALGAAAQRAVALVVLGVRADFYGRCLAYPPLLTALQSPVALGPMSVEQLREVINCPAQTVGLDLEPGLAELLLRDLGVTEDAGDGATSYDPGALPLLAHALGATWQQRDGAMLTVAGYRRTGGIRQALESTAEDAYLRQLGAPAQQVAREVLLRLVNVSEQGSTRDTRRRSSRSQLVQALPAGSDEAVGTVLRVFGRARLLTFDTDRDADSVEITHEALLSAWPRLRRWIDADRAGNLIRQELEDAAAGWDPDRRDTARLYRGSRLEAARSWATSATGEKNLSPAASAFLAASTQQHRMVRLRRAALVALSVLMLVALGAAVIAFWQRAKAQRALGTFTFNQIVAQADRLHATDVSLAAQLDIVAYRMQPTPALATPVLTDGRTALSTALRGHNQNVLAVAFSPNGRILATGSVDNTVRLWNVTDPTHPTPLGPPLAHPDWVVGVAFSPDGRTLATGSRDLTLRLWNVTDPAHPTPLSQLADHTGWVSAVAFSRDGRTLASNSTEMVKLWDVTDPAHPAPLGQLRHTAPVAAVAFSKDGRTLATGGWDNTVRLWNVTDPGHPAPVGEPLRGHQNWVLAVAFSPDGRTLASGGGDGTVRLWNVSDPAHPSSLDPTFIRHVGAVHSVAFSPDGRILASGGLDQTVRLWNVTEPADPRALGPLLTGHTSVIHAVVFSPDGHTLATGSADTTTRLWSIPPTLLTGHAEAVKAMAFSRDGHILASNSTAMVKLWDVTDPAHPAPLGELRHTKAVNAVALSRDGHTLAAGAADGMVQLWDITDPARPIPLNPPLDHGSAVLSVAFSPDGRTLVVGGDDRMLRLWNVSDPAHPAPLAPPSPGPDRGVNAVAVSPDGRTLVAALLDGTLRLWNVTDPTRPAPLGQPLKRHSGRLWTTTFSPDGRTLITTSDETVWLWNVTDPAHPSSLGQLTRDVDTRVYSVAFSPDGNTLASGSVDGTIRFWNVTDPAHPSLVGEPLAGHTGTVYSIAFSPDGRALASGGYDGTVRLWTMDVDQAIQRICATTPNTLTPGKWKQYVSPDLPYHPPCP